MALKIGSEDRKKVSVVAGLAILTVIVFFWRVYPYLGGGTAPAPPPTTVVAPTPAAPGANTGGAHQAAKISSTLAKLDPTLHPEWMAAAESLKYHGNGRNIFSMSSAPVNIETPKGPVRPSAQQVAAQGPPPPPPIDLKYFGYEAHAGGQRKVFLLHGDDVFIAAAGDVVDHRYKVVQIAPFSIQVQDIPFNNTQTLPLVQN